MSIDRPHLLWDGDCEFCGRWVAYWRELTGDSVVYRPFQDAPDLMAQYDLDEVETSRAVHLVTPAGRVYRAGEAVLRTLRNAPEPRFRWYLALYNVPGVADVVEGVYRIVAERRGVAARMTRMLWGRPHVETFSMAQFLFLRVLAVAAFFAFWSMWRQAPGLFGAHGILGFEDFLAQATQWGRQQGRDPQLAFPSLFWWLGASDTTLVAAAVSGMAASVALFVGLASRPMIVVMWCLYLSFVSLGQVFLAYQWDALLLETLFVALFFAPRGLLPRRTTIEQPGGRWLTWLLLFKLMFMAGVVKLLAHDSAWTDLTALQYHFWTQPIPNSVSPYVAALPAWVLEAGVVLTLFAETLVPLLIFAPRRLRHFGALVMLLLQLMILSTGTYGFFNLLAIALCLALFDDAYFRRSGFTRAIRNPPTSHGAVTFAVVVVSIALLLAPDDFAEVLSRAAVFLGGAALFIVVIMALREDGRTVRGDVRGLAVAISISLVTLAPVLPRQTRVLLAPLRTFNHYGLFASMTKTRPEIVVEWSLDGDSWTAYDFEYKPTSVAEPLQPTTYLMPRLDWQMWFAALQGCEGAPWLIRFVERLLQETPEVHALLEGGLPTKAPLYIRTRTFEYRFAEGDAVWERNEIGPFCPVMMLDDHGAVTSTNLPR